MSRVEFKNSPCHMSLRSSCRMSILRKAPVAVSNLRNGCVAVSILGVHSLTIVIYYTSRSGGLLLRVCWSCLFGWYCHLHCYWKAEIYFVCFSIFQFYEREREKKLNVKKKKSRTARWLLFSPPAVQIGNRFCCCARDVDSLGTKI